MAYIFGSGWDQLAGQRNYKDAQAIALAEADRAARQRAIDQEQENYKFQQQMAAREDEQAARLQQQAYATQLGLDQNRHQELREDYRFRLGRQDQATMDAENKRRYEAGVLTDKEKFNLTKGQNEAMEKRSQLGELVKMIRSGDIADATDVGQLFPLLTPQQIKFGNDFALKQTEAEAKDLAGAAANATAEVLKGQKPITKSTSHFYNPFSWGDKTIYPPVHLDENEAFAKLNANKAFQGYGDRLQWDSESQSFHPLGGKPRANPFAAVSPAPSLSPAVTNLAMNVPPMVAPTAGTPPYVFGPSSPAANPAIARAVGTPSIIAFPSPASRSVVSQPSVDAMRRPLQAQAAPGYKIGARYRGLVYLGGDPNLQTSWQPVQ